MKARLNQALAAIDESFWILPAILTAGGVLFALMLVRLDQAGAVPDWMVESAWLYNGGAEGARTLLGAVASTTIGIAGTVFTITIAALSLAAQQMGPRLLHNFTRDRGNQTVLGAFLGTFSYALMVLRTVRTEAEGAFVPHLALTVGIGLAFVCVAMLVYFVGHMAGRINVDTVIDLVSKDVRRAIDGLSADGPQSRPPPPVFWRDAVPVVDQRRGYLQQLDTASLAKWAADRHTVIRLLVGPGDRVFPGAPIALVKPPVDGVEQAIRNATALGWDRSGADDIEFAIRQLVEVAIRALSPGVNDPHTAISVIDRLGAALCDLAPLRLPSGVVLHEGKPGLVMPAVEYDGLVDVMFHMIRQSGSGSTAVLIRILDVLTAAVSCERQPKRVATLERHADLVMGDACRTIGNPYDLGDVQKRYRGFAAMKRSGPAAYLEAMASEQKTENALAPHLYDRLAANPGET
ncbi:DUF2254 domain-containing protein [Sinorhizobium alkalisoli]|uniref:Formate C-acetyltransferase glycine radical n=1 Tax=Sinorhizobium alkalisoli TaxID=1752398 RepID=A0A1E3VEX1_9HYPH|nr:DUF2254 domain-containing protein [Sinorhizobium alkalisoli]MCG5480998.1 DUF2254 domain-containing protein [Sinorhizobium alkalisoli]ODR92143.1 formate C-acetyltransferase glycine radical [Sinorhizobium alkalisoli]